MLAPIQNQSQHRQALIRIGELMDAVEGSPEITVLQVLAILVERYEHHAFPIDAPSPLDAIKFRMEQMGYDQSDLARLLGSRSRASELMTGSLKRLSIGMIKKLHRQWQIPAEALLRDAA